MFPKPRPLKSPPSRFDATAINQSYYNAVLQNILEAEKEYYKELQTVLSTYVQPLQTSKKLSSVSTSYLKGNLEEIRSFSKCLYTTLPEVQQRWRLLIKSEAMNESLVPICGDCSHGAQ